MVYLPIGMKSETSTQLGRPRAFDPDVALERAMHVFWAKGYEGASLSDLTRAMRINRPSLYAAFGNKEQLFRKALGRYQTGPMAFLTEALCASRPPGLWSRQSSRKTRWPGWATPGPWSRPARRRRPSRTTEH